MLLMILFARSRRNISHEKDYRYTSHKDEKPTKVINLDVIIQLNLLLVGVYKLTTLTGLRVDTSEIVTSSMKSKDTNSIDWSRTLSLVVD